MSSNARRGIGVALSLLVGCNSAAEPSPPPEPRPDAPAPLRCEPERGRLLVAEVLAAPADPCHVWLSALVGRAARVNGGSGSVWTRATAAGTGLLTTAGHVLSRCTSEGAPRDAEGNCPDTLGVPRDGRNLARLTAADGRYQSVWSPLFALYNNFVPRQELHSPTILPAHEVSVYVVDATTYEPWDAGKVTAEPSREPLVLHDPPAATLTPPTWADAAPGARVVALGYPFDASGRQTTLIGTVGRVLADDEVEQAQRELAARGDEEGRVAYDSAVEFFFRGTAEAGMSGAGVFDEQHRQIGVLVRASLPYQGTQYLRAVRMAYVVGKVRAALTNAAPELRAAVSPYVEANL